MPVPMGFRNCINPFEGLSDRELISPYRFPRHGILELLDLFEKDISRRTGRTYAIPAVTRLIKKKSQGYIPQESRSRFETEKYAYTYTHKTYI